MIGQFELTVGPYRSGELRVVSFSGREAMSSLFEFDVVFLSDLEWTELHPALFAKRATLTIHGPDGITRYVHGLVSDLEGRGGRAATGRREYRLRIVPRAALLAQRVSSRIFQDKTVREIVEAVLGNANIPHRWAALPNYPMRNYCLQYEESDLAFLERILSEHGIYYYFEHPTSLPDSEAEAAWSPLVDKLTDTVLDKATSLTASAAGALAGSVADGLRRELEASGDVMVFGDTPHAYRTMPVKTATEFAFALEFAKFEAMTAAERALSAGAESVGGLTGKGLGMGVSALADLAAVPLSPTPSLSLLPEGGMEHSETVTTFAVRRRLRPNSVELSDFAYANPMHNRSAKSTADTSSAPGGIEGKLATYAVGKVESGLDKAGAAVAEATGVNLGLPNPLADFWGGDPPIPVYRHRARYQESDATKPFASIMLDQLRADSTCAEGTGTCRRMAAGYRFVLAENDLSVGLSGDYVVTSIEHKGVVPEFAPDDLVLLSANYTNRFTCVPTDVVARPAFRPSPVQQVIESATVVGTSHAEGSLCVDELGRIKVQFHWDRDGKRDHHSSCWIRVSQPWAGRGWGFQFIPRVGMEVLVGFLGGDVDRPVVLGSAYNATHPVPFGLPGSATVSGIRTRSCLPQEGDDSEPMGHNQLSFDDAIGNEKVYVRAERTFQSLTVHTHETHVGQKDKRNESGEGYLLEHVATDRTRYVGQDERVKIARNAYFDVEVDEHRVVHRDQFTRVRNNLESVVEHDHMDRVEGQRTTIVEHTDSLRVDGDRTTRIGGRDRYVGAEDVDASLLANGILRVEGCLVAVVGKPEKKRSATLHVEGSADVYSTEWTELTSPQGLLLRCGDSSIRMTPKSVEIASPTLILRGGETDVGGETVRVIAKDDLSLSSPSMKLKAKGSALELADKARILGGSIELATASSALDELAAADAVPPTVLEVTDQEGKAVPNARFVLMLEDGSERSGVLDAEGKAEVLLEQSAKVVFPELEVE